MIDADLIESTLRGISGEKGSINLKKVVATFEKHIFLSQTDLTRTGIMKCLKRK
jgi:hypothetical protein